MGSKISKDKDNTTQPFLQPVKELQIVSLGKTGAGKSQTGNTILCNSNAFRRYCSSVSVTQKCESVTETVNGRTIKYIDTPGFFGTSLSEEDLRSEILRSIVKCAPGPHVFLIVLKVERYTEKELQEEDIVNKITEAFGEDALKHAVVLFTHGDNLNDGQTIEQFVSENSKLQQLVNKCGNRCHVIDNKNWNGKKKGYRSNRVQIESLMKTIDELRRQNGGEYYTNEMLQEVQRNIDNEIQEIREETNDEQPERQRKRQKKEKRQKRQRRSEQRVREEAEERMHTKLSVRLTGVATGAVLGALLGIQKFVVFIVEKMNKGDNFQKVAQIAAAVSVALPGTKELVATAAAGVFTGVAIAGAVKGGKKGYDAVEGEQTVLGAIKKAAHACTENE